MEKCIFSKYKFLVKKLLNLDLFRHMHVDSTNLHISREIFANQVILIGFNT